MAHYLKQGNLVRLVSNSTGKPLRAKDGVVDGNGGREGPWARFLVHERSNGVILLQNNQDRHNYIAIKNNNTCIGGGGPFCEFYIQTSKHNPHMVTLESAQFRGHHVGIRPDGCPKPPSQTGRGPHASFTVELIQAAQQGVGGLDIHFGGLHLHIGKQQPPPAQHPPPAPQPSCGQGQQYLQHGNTVNLICNSTGKPLRIKDGVVDGLGGRGGPWTRFVVFVRRVGVILLQSKQDPNNYLAIKNGNLCIGHAGPYCEFNIHTSNFNPSMISLESCSFPGQHVGIQNNGHVKPPANCGRGPNASYTVELLEAASPSGMQHMQSGNTVSLICNANGGPVRIKGGVVDSLGSRGGPFTRFIVQVRRPGVVVLQSKQEPHNYLAIKNDTVCPGQGGPFCEFNIHSSAFNPSMISLESCSSPGQHVGFQGNGQMKKPSACFRGPNASYTVELLEAAAAPHGGQPPPQPQGGPPSSGQYPPPSGQYPPPSGQYPPPAGQYPPPSGQYPPPAGQYPPPSGQYPPPAGQYPPPSGQYPPPTGQYPPPSGQYPPPDYQYPPPAYQYPPPGGQYPPPGGQYPPPGGQYPPPGGQYPPPGGQYPPPGGQYPTGSAPPPSGKYTH